MFVARGEVCNLTGVSKYNYKNNEVSPPPWKQIALPKTHTIGGANIGWDDQTRAMFWTAVFNFSRGINLLRVT